MFWGDSNKYPKHNYVIWNTPRKHADTMLTHVYTVKLGFTGVYFIFLTSVQNTDCGYSLEPPLCFEQKYEQYQNFYLKIIIVFVGKIWCIFE